MKFEQGAFGLHNFVGFNKSHAAGLHTWDLNKLHLVCLRFKQVTCR